VFPRVIALSIGLIPGVVVGALLLGRVAPSLTKLCVFAALLPLILLQASGKRWPIRNEQRAAVPLGVGVGLVYGLTTISGPPLALFWNNQGVAKEDFKVALALVRSIESVCALLAYTYLGLLTWDSAAILPWIGPGVLIGFPLGHVLINRIGIETFRRVCMSFDAYIVSFGLARTLADAGVPSIAAYQVMVAVLVIDAALLWAFFRARPAMELALDPVLRPAGASATSSTPRARSPARTPDS
jgi:uncharacterized membrane protein YfcA